MSAAAPAALAAVLLVAAAWEIAGSGGGGIQRLVRGALREATIGRSDSIRRLVSRLGISQRLRHAGAADRVPVAAVLAAKAACAVLGGLAALALAPAAPGRLAAPVAIMLPLAGFFTPDAMLEREARRRRRRIVDALPDALDLMAVGAAAGRSPATVLGEIAAATSGPLAAELSAVVAQVECGASQADALDGLRGRVPGAEVAALSTAIERSRRYGSPLADQLRDQATALRSQHRRRIEERAARAAPKIQLVVALVLVPSVLLTIIAALIANSERLLAGF